MKSTGLDNVQDGKLLYHLTKLKNMRAIIEDGLCSRKSLNKRNLQFYDVADAKIINKRKELGLDQYIPFHFHPYSAFDNAVKNTYEKEKFVYICIKRAFAEYNNFKILVSHPLSKEDCILYDYKEGIERIDWDTMKTKGRNDSYAKNVKMAECITKKRIPAELFQCVYVPDSDTKKYITDLFQNKGITEHPPYTDIQPKWFVN